MLQQAFQSASYNLLHALNSSNEQTVLDKIVNLVKEEFNLMKISPLAALEKKEI